MGNLKGLGTYAHNLFRSKTKKYMLNISSPMDENIDNIYIISITSKGYTFILFYFVDSKLVIVSFDELI